jgi:hypothetical protein
MWRLIVVMLVVGLLLGAVASAQVVDMDSYIGVGPVQGDDGQWYVWCFTGCGRLVAEDSALDVTDFREGFDSALVAGQYGRYLLAEFHGFDYVPPVGLTEPLPFYP